MFYKRDVWIHHRFYPVPPRKEMSISRESIHDEKRSLNSMIVVSGARMFNLESVLNRGTAKGQTLPPTLRNENISPFYRLDCYLKATFFRCFFLFFRQVKQAHTTLF